MDMDILLWLQETRLFLGPVIEEIVILISDIGGGALSLILPCIFYWLSDKKTGILLFFSFSLGNLANALIKMTACVYRPWIRDARIIPAPGGIRHARGYSFPSGHSQAASSEWLLLGWIRRHKAKWILPVSIGCVFLIMFSRCYLGYHTPQDVLTGFLVSIPLTAASVRLFNASGKGNRMHMLAGAAAAGILALIYFEVKSYPMDYDSGILRVDPEEMKLSAFEAVGYFLGVHAGWYLEEKYIRFAPAVTKRDRIFRMVTGLGGVLLAWLIIPLALENILAYKWYGLTRGFMTFFTAVYIVPLIFAKWEEHKNGKSSD